MECTSCGMDNPQGGQFCIRCGALMAAASPASSTGYVVRGIELLPGETVVMTWGEMVLTNRRVVYRFASGCLRLGGSEIGVALLEDIDSVAVVRRRLQVLLIGGLLLLMAGVVGLLTEVDVVMFRLPALSTEVDVVMIALLVLGVLFVLGYFLTPINTLLLTVGGAPFVRQALFSLGSGAKDVQQFINRLYAMKVGM